MAVVLDAHGARLADAAEVVAAQIDQHQVLGALLVVVQELLLQKQIFFLVLPAPPRTGDRMRRRAPVLHRDQRFGT
jgi:hypothetical protein